VGCERVGELAKGGAVDSRPGTRVDGYSHHEQKKLVLQVSNKGMRREERGGMRREERGGMRRGERGGLKGTPPNVGIR
jgi:hypothetical protein